MRRLRLADRVGPGARTRRADRPRQHDHAPPAPASGAARRIAPQSLVDADRGAWAIAWCRSMRHRSPPRGQHRPRADPRARCGRLRRGQRHAAVDRHLGRRGRRTAARHGAGHARPAALVLRADRHAGHRLCREAVLHLRRRGAAPDAHQHGRADQRRRHPGHRHEPGADNPGRRSHLFRFRGHVAVLPADRPRAGPSRPRPGARDRRAAC